MSRVIHNVPLLVPIRLELSKHHGFTSHDRTRFVGVYQRELFRPWDGRGNRRDGGSGDGRGGGGRGGKERGG